MKKNVSDLPPVKFRRKRWSVCVALAAMVVVAGCGSSGKTSSPSGTTSPNGTTSSKGTTAPKSPINIGVDGSFNGPLASSEANGLSGIEAWEKSVNAGGGIDGHPVNLIVKQDEGDVTTGVADVKSLISQDHVVAMLDSSDVDGDWGPYAESHGVPVFGIPTNVSYMTNPDFYPAGGNLISGFYGLMALAKQNGPKFAEIYCAGAAVCQAVVPLLKGIGATLGVSLVYSNQAAATLPDYTAICQAVKNSGAQSWNIATSSAELIKIASQCKQEGVTAKLITAAGTLTPNFDTNPGTENTLVSDVDFPFFYAGSPASAAFHAAIKTYEPQAVSTIGVYAGWLWTAGKLLQAAVQASGKSTVTSASIKSGLYALKGETLGGLAPPLTYTPGKPNLEDCYITWGIGSGKFELLKTGVTPACAPRPLVAAIAAKL